MKEKERRPMRCTFRGVFPALTTPFDAAGSVDLAALHAHARWMVESGVAGLVPLGSLGESATLAQGEKRAILETCARASHERVPVVPGIAALSTADAVQLAKDAATLGASGLMVLPPYVYSSDWREMRAHVSAVLAATKLPCMLYNNPVAYRTDFLPEQVAELAAEHPNLVAVKESSGDVRRITALRALLGDRVEVLVGLDDLVVEGVAAGATGWVAGLVNALPAESVALFEAAAEGRVAEATGLYRWFLPLLRMDTVPKFVQLIKLCQERVGRGSARVRSPRLPLAGAELECALTAIDAALATRPAVAAQRANGRAPSHPEPLPWPRS
jgi:4-hydroxy-tetrahydrodipicolinate synthase